MTTYRFPSGNCSRQYRGTISLAAFAVALVVSGPAAGQTTDSQPTARSALGTDDIIVTARKRGERLQDVPVTITAFAGNDLQRQGTGSIQQIAERTPQLMIGSTSTPSNGTINMRGIGSADTSPSIDQAVSINVDGVQVSQANAIILGLYDLDRVEILKGPQALFFGKSSPAGVISLISASPSKNLEWRLRSGYETEADRRFVEGMISAPLTDTLGIRLVGAFDRSNGWFRDRAAVVPGGVGTAEDTAPDLKEYFVRGTMKYVSPSEIFDATLKFSYDRQTQQGGATSTSQLIACPLGSPQGSFGVPGASTDCKLDRYTDETDISPAAAALAPNYLHDGKSYTYNQQMLGSFTANAHLSETLTLTSVTGYYNSRVAWNAQFNDGDVERLVTASDTRTKQWTEELRLASKFDFPINFVVGGFYQNAKLNFGVPAIVAGPLGAAFVGTPTPTLLANDLFKQTTNAYSFFGQAIWAFAPKWELTAGGRYSKEDKSANGIRLPSVLSGFQTLPLPFVDPSVSFNNFSPEVTLRFKLTPDVTFFGAYRTGFTSGGYNFAPISFSVARPNDNTFKQAKAKGGEIGVKAAVAQRQVRFDLSLYNYDYTDLQLSALQPGTVALTILNAGSAVSRGVEFTTTVNPNQIRGLSLRSSVAYNDAHYKLFDNAGCYTGQTITLGCSGSTVNGVANSQDLSGRQLERAPSWTMNFGASQDVEIGDLTASLSGDANYISGFYSDAAHDPRAYQKEAWRFNASVSLRGPRDGWELSVIGKNLTNTLRAIRSANLPFTGFGTGTNGPARLGDIQGTISAPRSVLLQLTIRNSVLQ